MSACASHFRCFVSENRRYPRRGEIGSKLSSRLSNFGAKGNSPIDEAQPCLTAGGEDERSPFPYPHPGYCAPPWRFIFDFNLQPIVPSGLVGATHARTTYRCTGKRCFPITAPVSNVRVPFSATGYHGPSRAICEFASVLRDRRAFTTRRRLIGGIYDIRRKRILAG